MSCPCKSAAIELLESFQPNKALGKSGNENLPEGKLVCQAGHRGIKVIIPKKQTRSSPGRAQGEVGRRLERPGVVENNSGVK